MQVGINLIKSFCDAYLRKGVNKEFFQDYCVNGLQVEGCKHISRIITGVSISERLITEAINKKAQLIIVHHGFFKSDFDSLPCITGVNKNRLKMLLENDINLMGFHLPLDAHPIIGNNISICKAIGLTKCKPISVGFVGTFKKPIEINKLVSLVNYKVRTNAALHKFGSRLVKKVVVISGAASDMYHKAIENDADTFICGDMREDVVRKAQETRLNIINAWHYNSERFGVMNLGKLISKKFKIPCEFVEIPCEI